MTNEDLQSLRRAHGLTQRALGELLGYTANHIARLERSKDPMPQRFEKLVRSILGHTKEKKSFSAP